MIITNKPLPGHWYAERARNGAGGEYFEVLNELLPEDARPDRFYGEWHGTIHYEPPIDIAYDGEVWAAVTLAPNGQWELRAGEPGISLQGTDAEYRSESYVLVMRRAAEYAPLHWWSNEDLETVL